MKENIKETAKAIKSLMSRIGRPVRLMEVCGTHTVAMFRQGIRSVIPDSIKLLSGPGCPVCVTSVMDVDISIEIAKRPNTVLYTFGDMMRVPGGVKSLNEAKAEGAKVEIVYSPLDALSAAEANPDIDIVFFATGFETTIPLVAATIIRAGQRRMKNFRILSVHKLVPPALNALLADNQAKIDGFILPGHVSTIIGSEPYEFVSRDYKIPCAITGFDSHDILEGIMMLLRQIAENRPRVEIQYSRVVRPEGNPKAVWAVGECFEPCDAYWRGIGPIPLSGLRLNKKYSFRNAASLIDTSSIPQHREPRGCSCGSVLRGIKVPTDCPLFGRRCTPTNPVGACMVSTEGSCAAYYKYSGAGR